MGLIPIDVMQVGSESILPIMSQYICKEYVYVHTC